MTRALRKLGEFSCRCSNFSSLQMFFERERAERAEIATAARNTHRNKVCKFKLYYSRKFRVLRSTKVSNTFLHNSKPRDVIKFGLPVLNWAQKWFFCHIFPTDWTDMDVYNRKAGFSRLEEIHWYYFYSLTTSWPVSNTVKMFVSLLIDSQLNIPHIVSNSNYSPSVLLHHCLPGSQPPDTSTKRTGRAASEPLYV